MIREGGPSLSEASKWIQTFRGKCIIIKLGGELLTSPAIIKRLTKQIAVLSRVGIQSVIVHGAGVQVDLACKERGIEPKKVGGRRITDQHVLDILVETQLKLNSSFVDFLAAEGVPALGMNSMDPWPVHAHRRPPVQQADGSVVDFGHVGDVTGVHFEGDCQERIVVLPSLGHDKDNYLNINADTLARSVAVACGAEKLVYMTGVSGVMRSMDEAGPISEMRISDLRKLIDDGIAVGGMKAKLEEVEAALNYGVPQVHIISGKEPFTLLLELFTNEGCGTLITA
ncbi:acetylglutamate kinase [Kamptonema cortianum]|nr:acetylglutamate kinase [Geitlerinema splendidum]MDK3156270.1 acetylglutamate kinase [Kamptonema cortianum]